MRFISVLALLLVPSLASAQQPTREVVPDSATAVRVAVAVWIPMYGERAIMAQQPFVAKLNDGVWTVTARPSRAGGPLIVLDGVVVSELASAGAPVAKIARRDARVIDVSTP